MAKSAKHTRRTRARGKQPPKEGLGTSGLLIVGVVVAAFVVAGGLILLATDPFRSPATTTDLPRAELIGTPGPAGEPGPTEGGFPVQGSPDAPVVMVEYSDFQCPHCKNFAESTARLIEEEYIKAGKVRHVYKYFSILGPESSAASEAAQCANDQGRFWEYHDLLFSQQSGRNQGAFSRDNLIDMAAQLGLDTNVFRPCLESGKYAGLVQQGLQEGQAQGVGGTPTFYINGVEVVGAASFDEFQRVIEAQLLQGGG